MVSYFNLEQWFSGCVSGASSTNILWNIIRYINPRRPLQIYWLKVSKNEASLYLNEPSRRLAERFNMGGRSPNTWASFQCFCHVISREPDKNFISQDLNHPPYNVGIAGRVCRNFVPHPPQKIFTWNSNLVDPSEYYLTVPLWVYLVQVKICEPLFWAKITAKFKKKQELELVLW